MAENVEVPSQKEIATLPRSAQVAFAVRCARRVQPLFTFFWPGAPQKNIDGVEKAISIAEQFAAGDVTANAANVANAAVYAANAVYAARDAVYAANAANAVYAARAAVYAANVANAVYVTRVAANVVNAVYAANAAARAAADAANKGPRDKNWVCLVIQEIRSDFEKLLTAAKKEKWNDKRMIPPEFFGPMWPEGMPEGWPEGPTYVRRSERRVHSRAISKWLNKKKRFGFIIPDDGAEQPVLEFYIKPGNASKETVLEVLNALSEYHRAAGGIGLEFTFDGQYVYASEGVNV